MCECFLISKIRRIPVRAWIIAIIFMTSFMNSALISNISLCIRYMVHLEKQSVPFCKNNTGQETALNTMPNYGPRFNWSTEAQRHIQVAYFYGIAIASPVAGFLAEWLGPKNTIFWPLLFAGILNTLSAVCASWGWGVPLVCRFIVGLATGTVSPALQCFVGLWAPPDEKGKFINAIMGSSLGTAFIWCLIRFISPSLGWPWTFYILSILIVIYCPIFWLLSASNPDDHKFITLEEIDYIRICQGGSVSLKKDLPPVRKILTSSHCWALTILNFGSSWVGNIQLQVIPNYFETYMGLNENESILLAILPHIVRFGSAMLFGNVADFIQKRQLMTCTAMSKTYVVFSHLFPGFIMMGLGTVKCDTVLALILIFLCNFLTGAAVGAELRTPTDLSPNFAGTIYGINICLAQTTGFIVPSLSEWILGTNAGILQWTIVFLIGGGASFGTGVIYLWFGSAEVQPWNIKKGRGLSLYNRY